MRAINFGSVTTALVSLAAACAPVDPSDDPKDWQVERGVEFTPVLSEPQFIIPSDENPVVTNVSNNNVGIEIFEGDLYVGWRTAPTHFAGADTEMHMIAARLDDVRAGKPRWREEGKWYLGGDVREPNLFRFDGKLHFAFFEAGTSIFAFDPRALWRTERNDDGTWAGLESWGSEKTVAWDVKVRNGEPMMTLYTGNHYEQGAQMQLRFLRSQDAKTWTPEGGAADVYTGGCSEAGFELDDDGSLWAILRNEDGDATGFGALLCHAPAGDLNAWECPTESDPERYDSPKMLRHGDDVYIVARRDIGGPFDRADPSLAFDERRQRNLIDYWNRPKRTALYRVDKDANKVVHELDFPSAGDTAFPSIRRLDADTFLIANYTSPLDDPDRTWLEAQEAPDGTSIYLVELKFEPR